MKAKKRPAIAGLRKNALFGGDAVCLFGNAGSCELGRCQVLNDITIPKPFNMIRIYPHSDRSHGRPHIISIVNLNTV